MSDTQSATMARDEIQGAVAPMDSQQARRQPVPPPETANPFRSSDPRRKSPFLAALLSLMPGLGQVYVGYYRRGFINILTAGSVFSFLVATQGQTAITPLASLFLIFFVLYNIIDAGRRASLYNLSLDGIEQIELPDPLSDNAFSGTRGSFLGGGALLLFGLIALSNTALGISLAWLEDWWPLAPTALGAYLVFRAYQDQQQDAEGGASGNGQDADSGRPEQTDAQR